MGCDDGRGVFRRPFFYEIGCGNSRLVSVMTPVRAHADFVLEVMMRYLPVGRS